MADLSGWINQVQQALNNTDQNEQNALNNNGNAALGALDNNYNNQLTQAQQKLGEIPGNYDDQRSAADLTKNQGMGAINDWLADNGQSTDSGANYQARTNIGNAFQKGMTAIGKAQNQSTEDQNNAINTLKTNYSSSRAEQAAKNAETLANLQSQQYQNVYNQASSDYQNEQQREEQEREYQEELAARKQEMQMQIAAERSYGSGGGGSSGSGRSGGSVRGSRSGGNSGMNAQLKTAQKAYYHKRGSYAQQGNAAQVMQGLMNSGLNENQIEYIAGHIYDGQGRTLAQSLSDLQNAAPREQRDMSIGTGHSRVEE